MLLSLIIPPVAGLAPQITVSFEVLDVPALPGENIHVNVTVFNNENVKYRGWSSTLFTPWSNKYGYWEVEFLGVEGIANPSMVAVEFENPPSQVIKGYRGIAVMLESPPDFAENNPIPPGSLVKIMFRIAVPIDTPEGIYTLYAYHIAYTNTYFTISQVEVKVSAGQPPETSPPTTTPLPTTPPPTTPSPPTHPISILDIRDFLELADDAFLDMPCKADASSYAELKDIVLGSEYSEYIVTLGGPIVNNMSRLLDDMMGIEFKIEDDGGSLCVGGSMFSISWEEFGTHDYSVICVGELNDRAYLSCQGITRYGTWAASCYLRSLLSSSSTDFLEGVKIVVLEWIDMNGDMRVDREEVFALTVIYV
ncbi:MAG: hypothetical protein DRN81_05575 [Thermoproteota archaeon]|nr:MAG: hypothetical protein DRN81_05575 [Candidatus Korarchaeota archaeon]